MGGWYEVSDQNSEIGDESGKPIAQAAGDEAGSSSVSLTLELESTGGTFTLAPDRRPFIPPPPPVVRMPFATVMLSGPPGAAYSVCVQLELNALPRKSSEKSGASCTSPPLEFVTAVPL